MANFLELLSLKCTAYCLDNDTIYCLETPTRLVVIDVCMNTVIDECKVIKSSKILLENGMIICIGPNFIQVISPQDLSLKELR
jgi:hypothetical protein